MYVPFFGLQQVPFSIAPDPRYLFMSERHREALAHLLYGLDAGGGFVLLTGEIGTGKTTICRCFLEQIPAHCNVAYIFNPKLTVPELLRSICDEFGVAHHATAPGAETVKDCLDPLNEFLLQQHAAGRNNVLIIDEAQNLAPELLEQLRLLTNLETSERKLLQIILIGQPELRAMVAAPELEQLAQRVIARYHLQALSLEETRQYIAHRLAVAGLQGPLPFQHRALERVHALAGGVPRRINLLCDRALLGTYGAGLREVSDAVVRRAAREVFDAPSGAAAAARPVGAGGRWWFAGIGGLAGAAAVGALGWVMGWWPLAPVGGTPAGVAAAPAVAASQGPAQSLAMPAGPAASAERAPTDRAAEPAASAEPAVAAPAAASVAFTAPAAPAAAASVAAPPAAATPDTASTSTSDALAQFLGAQPVVNAWAGWQLLAGAWRASIPPQAADACAALLPKGLRCYRHRRVSLNLLRLLDRPALLTLQPQETAGRVPQPVVAVLSRLDGDMATLSGVKGTKLQLSVAELATLWRGEIATLWRAPVNLPRGEDMAAIPAGATWLDRQLNLAAAAAPAGSGPATERRRARIHQFQLQQGLTPDGQAGPLTLMMLNRATGVKEPRLSGGA